MLSQTYRLLLVVLMLAVLRTIYLFLNCIISTLILVMGVTISADSLIQILRSLLFNYIIWNWILFMLIFIIRILTFIPIFNHRERSLPMWLSVCVLRYPLSLVLRLIVWNHLFFVFIICSMSCWWNPKVLWLNILAVIVFNYRFHLSFINLR